MRHALTLAAMPLFALAATANAQTTPTTTPTPGAPPTAGQMPTTGAPQTPATGAAQATGAASATATPTVGATVYGSAGTPVGTIESVSADAVVINTGTGRLALPPASIGKSEKGLAIGLTKEQLDAQAASAAATAATDLKSKLVAGAAVSARDGKTPLGTIKSADDQFVTVTTTRGTDVRLPIAGFGMGPNGVLLGMTANEFNAAVGGTAAPR